MDYLLQICCCRQKKEPQNETLQLVEATDTRLEDTQDDAVDQVSMIAAVGALLVESTSEECVSPIESPTISTIMARVPMVLKDLREVMHTDEASVGGGVVQAACGRTAEMNSDVSHDDDTAVFDANPVEQSVIQNAEQPKDSPVEQVVIDDHSLPSPLSQPSAACSPSSLQRRRRGAHGVASPMSVSRAEIDAVESVDAQIESSFMDARSRIKEKRHKIKSIDWRDAEFTAASLELNYLFDGPSAENSSAMLDNIDLELRAQYGDNK